MAKKKSKHYPVVLNSKVGYTAPPAGTTYLIQVDQFLSKLNRRLYRQGRYYQAKIDLDVSSNANIEVFALRDDWAVQKAFQRGYQEYLDNTMEERERLGDGQQGRWGDFRVEPGTAGTVTDLVPVLSTAAGSDVQLTAGEFALAQVVDDAGTAYFFTWGATSASRFGLLEEYDKVGNAQTTPDSRTADAPYVDINSEVNEQTHDHLQDAGNAPPYDESGVNAGAPFVKIAELGSGSSGTGAQKLSTGFFTAPCGLILITGMNAVDVDDVVIEMKRGDYKGVHAPSMIEVATVNRKRKVVK
jgi:hypothetical protein